MVDIQKKELNKLCKAYNIIDSFNNMRYCKSEKLNLYDIKEGLKTQIEEILKDAGYNLKVNNSGNRFILVRCKE